MKKKGSCILLAFLVLVLTGGVILMSYVGLLSRRYVIGKNLSTSSLTKVTLSSSGMHTGLCWNIALEIMDGEADVRYEGYFENGEQEKTGHLNRKQLRVVLGYLEGHSYARVIKNPLDRMVLDKTVWGLRLSFPKAPGSDYTLRMTYAEFTDLRDTIVRLMNDPEDMSLTNLVGIAFECGGDSLGSVHDISLEKKNGRWILRTLDQESWNAKEVVTETEVGSKVMEQVKEILGEYDWASMKDLPASELQALDAATTTLELTFEPRANWRLSTDQEWTEEAHEMWGRLKEVLTRSAGK